MLGPQLTRLHHLLHWLGRGRPLTTRLAAEALEVSRRTIANDIERLRSLGVPVAYDPRAGTYKVSEPFGTLPAVSLSRSELAAFLVARHALDAFGDDVHAPVLAEAAERLAAALPEAVHVDSALLARAIRFEAGPQPRAALPHIELLTQAVEEQRLVEMTYYANAKGELTQRAVEPLLLLVQQGRWYLVAYCRLRQGLRHFRLDRMRSLTLTDEAFAVPADRDVDAYLEPSFGVHYDARTYAVCVRFSPYQARWIREEHWHESQVLVERADGSLELRMQVTGLADVTRWVLSYGSEAEVLSPPVLRHRVARETRRMANLYCSDPEESASDPS